MVITFTKGKKAKHNKYAKKQEGDKYFLNT